jgi:glycine hydroxymethyltransferase
VVDYIEHVLMNHDNKIIIQGVRQEINTWMQDYPLFQW